MIPRPRMFFFRMLCSFQHLHERPNRAYLVSKPLFTSSMCIQNNYMYTLDTCNHINTLYSLFISSRFVTMYPRLLAFKERTHDGLRAMFDAWWYLRQEMQENDWPHKDGHYHNSMSLADQQALESGNRPSRLRRHLPTQPTHKISRSIVSKEKDAPSTAQERRARSRIQLIPSDRSITLQRTRSAKERAFRWFCWLLCIGWTIFLVSRLVGCVWLKDCSRASLVNYVLDRTVSWLYTLLHQQGYVKLHNVSNQIAKA